MAQQRGIDAASSPCFQEVRARVLIGEGTAVRSREDDGSAVGIGGVAAVCGGVF